MVILDGKFLSNKIKLDLKNDVKLIKSEGKRPPHLVAILIGQNPASQTYVNAKKKACEEIGFDSTIIKFKETISEQELLEKIKQTNLDNTVDGLIVQLPLPDHIDPSVVIRSISYKKDVDGFHPINLGNMMLEQPCFLPATPFGIITLIENFNIKTIGKNCLIIGRSHIVGTPMSVLMSRNVKFANCTVTLAHSKTKNLDFLTKNADIIIVALGKPKFLKKEMIKESVVVIDVGINRIKSDKTKSGWALVGDVDFDQVKNKTSHITPVPGGVGPMTIISLLRNTLLSYKRVIYK
jgi:methylenetetrahydrofolate dehydrogenase (NADP+)/methenyltetrahydrofolate cyclohydrolase